MAGIKGGGGGGGGGGETANPVQSLIVAINILQ